MEGLVSRNRHLLVPFGLVLVLGVIAAVRAPQTFTYVGLAGALLVAAPLILAAIAITPIAIAGRGGVDLSIGPLIGFVNVTIVVWLTGNGITHPVLVFAYAILAACAWQALLAALIIHVRISPIIASLAGFMILSGVNLVILSRPGGFAPEWLGNWGWGTELLSPVLYILVAACVIWALFSRTPLFQHIRLMGADERTAYTSGVDIVKARYAAHLLAGVFAGLAALCLTGLIGSGDPTQGNTLTLQAITALVLGGTSLSGGKGGITGSILGALAMYLVFVVLSSFNFGAISGFMTQLFYGLMLVISLMLALVTSRRRVAAV
ncbi:inner-membrane translocator [Dinoroseobacter shibae DFL 12 = DSM 16493]|jgi:ribose transport system permease protein|uniref:Inner-membrane translocator n=1 Tax=Dinoroseobacter shibae (strain DSM 16493 / NCIMB 14021 / DFL 12) TaxID=398580 RepID=A8LJE3_DINSH|nr:MULTISPECIES: ABC transporter permease [Dinoroseobacter]ABV93165.1 inner-membrane translocator [Dinoroseobacter shibae DFL 12 = DSM 16493]MDD9715742.1 ABC transporter permease [Dinoroseobacter sp. PD6]URF48091.1 ABC transporter permease [Dinoroseobacter shibae]URF52401.1 ABC transporter permease [Dinoroseobacter shibae]